MVFNKTIFIPLMPVRYELMVAEINALCTYSAIDLSVGIIIARLIVLLYLLQMALKHHPDKNPNNPEATEKVREPKA